MTPDYRRVEGTVTATRPLPLINGMAILLRRDGRWRWHTHSGSEPNVA